MFSQVRGSGGFSGGNRVSSGGGGRWVGSGGEGVAGSCGGGGGGVQVRGEGVCSGGGVQWGGGVQSGVGEGSKGARARLVVARALVYRMEYFKCPDFYMRSCNHQWYIFDHQLLKNQRSQYKRLKRRTSFFDREVFLQTVSAKNAAFFM